MAINSEIRQVFADLDDIQEWLSADIQPEMDESRFYIETSIFSKRGDPLGYICWSRQMELTEPGKLSAGFYGQLDYGDGARSALEPFVDGLDNCTLRLFYGHLLPEAQRRKGLITFELLPPTKAPQVLVMIKWPDGLQPGYDKRPDLMSAELIQRINPGENSYAEDGVGYDVWAVPQEKLGSEFARRTEEWESFRRCVSLNDWRDFELHKDYYRQRMQTICDDIQGTMKLAYKMKLSAGEPIKIEFHEDYVKTFLSEAYATDGDAVVRRHWYNKAGYEGLENFRLMLAPLRATLITLKEIGIF